MANYTLANLVKAQIKLAGEFASNDTRYRIPAVFLFILKGSEAFFPKYKDLKTSDKRVVEANYFKRTVSALTTTGRSHNHTGSHGDSGVITLAWNTYSSTFSMTLKQADGSVMSFQEMFNNEIRNKIIAFAEGLDAAAVNFLFANKSGVNPATVKGSFNGTKTTYEITASTFQSQAITISKTVMDINKYQGQNLNIVCDSNAYTTFQQQAYQGAQNATNQSFQFLETTFVHAPQLTALAIALGYTNGYWLMVPDGHVACLDWIPAPNKKGVSDEMGIYGSLMNPVDGLQYAVHSYKQRVDGTSVNGEVQDVSTETELSIDVCFQYAPSSTTNETPIQAFGLV